MTHNQIASDLRCFCLFLAKFICLEPQVIIYNFINTFSPPRTRHFHRNRRPLARSPFLHGFSLPFCFSRFLLVAEFAASQNCGAATSVDAPTYAQALLSRLTSQKVCFDSSSSSRRRLRAKMFHVC